MTTLVPTGPSVRRDAYHGTLIRVGRRIYERFVFPDGTVGMKRIR